MKQYAYYLILLILTAALLFQCDRTMESDSLMKANSKVYSDSIRYFRNELNSQTATIRTLQVDRDNLKAIVLDKDKELQKLVNEFSLVKSITKTHSTVKIEPITVRLKKPFVTADSSNFKQQGVVETQWYRLGYSLTKDSLTISPFSTWTETTIITGLKRKWLLGEQTLVTDITNTNPYIKVDNVVAANIVVPEPWYKKWYVWLAAGLAGGILLK